MGLIGLNIFCMERPREQVPDAVRRAREPRDQALDERPGVGRIRGKCFDT